MVDFGAPSPCGRTSTFGGCTWLLPGIASFVLLQYELIFGAFLLMAAVVMIAMGSAPAKRRILVTFLAGAGLSVGLLLLQLLIYFGSPSRLFAEAVATWTERNTVLYAWRTVIDSRSIPTDDLIDIFVQSQPGRFGVPVDFEEYLHSLSTALYSFYGPLLLACLFLLAVIALWRVDRKQAPGPTELMSHPIIRITIGCLVGLTLLGFIARGYTAYIYFMLRYPLLSLVVFMMVAAVAVAFEARARGWAAPVVGVFALGAVAALLTAPNGWIETGIAGSSPYGNREFRLLEQHSSTGDYVGTNAEWPITGVLHGIVDRRAIDKYTPSEVGPKFYLCRAPKSDCAVTPDRRVIASSNRTTDSICSSTRNDRLTAARGIQSIKSANWNGFQPAPPLRAADLPSCGQRAAMRELDRFEDSYNAFLEQFFPDLELKDAPAPRSLS
jgi:hypothetical protein